MSFQSRNVIGLVYDLTMASLHKKKIGKHVYYYARESRRVGGRPKIVWQKYLGRLDTILAAVDRARHPQPVPQPEPGGWVIELGASAALYDLARRLHVAEIVDRHVPKQGRGPSVGTYLETAAINRCVDPRSKASMGAWYDTTVLRRFIDISARQLTSQRYWDNMHRVDEAAIRAIETDLARQAVEVFDLDLSRLLFDATNFFTFLDSFNERSTLAQRGHSKEGRASLRIIGLALLVTSDFHVPLFHDTYPGNRSDPRTFAELCDRLTERCRALVDGVEQVTWIFDKGNNSEQNLEAIARTPFHFIGSLVPTQHPRLLEVPRTRFRSLEADGLPGVWVYRTRYPVFGVERTVLVVYNERLFVAQSRTLLREIAKRQQQLQELAARLESWQRGEKRGGGRPQLAATQKKVRRLLQARHMKDLFAVDVREQDGLPLVHYRFVQSAWERLQETLLGKTLVFSDHENWSDGELVRGYRSQSHVEDAFRILKDPHHIALRPQYHWTDQKIRVHVLICVMALMLVSLLERELHRKGIDLSIPAALRLLGGIREMTMLFAPPSGQSKPVLRTCLTRMSPEQCRLFEALELHRYSSP